MLGQWLIPRPSQVPAPPIPSANPLARPLRQLLEGGNRVLVSFEDSVVARDPAFPGLWPDDGTLAGAYCNMDKLESMLSCNEEKALQLPLGSDGRVSEMWYTLTEQAEDIVDGVLEPSKYPSTLFELASEADSRF